MREFRGVIWSTVRRKKLGPHQHIRLFAEPDNPFDHNAIAINIEVYRIICDLGLIGSRDLLAGHYVTIGYIARHEWHRLSLLAALQNKINAANHVNWISGYLDMGTGIVTTNEDIAVEVDDFEPIPF